MAGGFSASQRSLASLDSGETPMKFQPSTVSDVLASMRSFQSLVPPVLPGSAAARDFGCFAARVTGGAISRLIPGLFAFTQYPTNGISGAVSDWSNTY